MWQTVLADLGERTASTQRDVWLRNCCVLAVEGEEMTVGAPNRFAADCLRDKMGRSIVEATSRILGRKVNVDYEAAGARVTHRLSSKWNPNTRTDYDAGREQMSPQEAVS
ncbi:MAG: hypothetical protein ACUVX1_15930 [Chloroflexota bacterium]